MAGAAEAHPRHNIAADDKSKPWSAQGRVLHDAATSSTHVCELSPCALFYQHGNLRSETIDAGNTQQHI